MASDPIYRRVDGWAWRSFGGSVLLMRRPPDAVQLDGAAAIVWTALEAPATWRGVADRSASAWATAPGEPAALIEAAIGELVRIGAIETTPATEPIAATDARS